jgi:hypothetical protein
MHWELEENSADRIEVMLQRLGYIGKAMTQVAFRYSKSDLDVRRQKIEFIYTRETEIKNSKT